MKELISEYGFVQYSTGCPCQGLPRYYKNGIYPDYRIVTKTGMGIIKRNGAELFRTRDVELLRKKMNELFKKN
jgi:hypothetical protein